MQQTHSSQVHTLRQKLTHVLWIGGPTDAGKSTVARTLAERHGLHVCHYDRYDRPHTEQLAQASLAYQAALTASLTERWIDPSPEDLLQRLFTAFYDRFPLVLDDLLARPADTLIIAEGFGLLPDLVRPLLSAPHQAVWLLPTDAFKRASFERRGKPSFAAQTADPERAGQNLFARDMLLTHYYREQLSTSKRARIEVDGSRPAGELADRVAIYFGQYRRLR